jgi:4-amino-4-deoxy-L-arabinose transferase-like glycosyltransferase
LSVVSRFDSPTLRLPVKALNDTERAAISARVVDALTILVFACFVLGCLYGIASPWQWGHNGFNGAAFCQAARNTLRFHVLGQALYYTGLTPPAPGTLYTHHPQMLHLHLIALFALLGQQPWVGRLIPATYSVLTLVLIHRIALRWWDRVVALVAIALYAFTPLHTIFANMIDHEQGAIFWTLLAVWAYLRFREENLRKHFVICLIAISCGAQFDWPPYYVAFFIAAHALVMGLRAGKPLLRWRREWTFVLVFSAVVLANFGGFFAWIYRQRGTLAEMGQAYSHRTGVARGYLDSQWQRIIDLHGPVIGWLTVLWLPLVIARLVRREAKERDLIPGFFFAAQVVHSLLFRNAGSIHSYWTYWIGTATALGGADVAVSTYRTLHGWVKEQPKARLARIALVVTAVAMVLFQVRYAYARLRWGFRTGTASYVSPTPDVRTEVRIAKLLAQRYARNETFYLFHESVPARIEVHWYHDTPFEQRSMLAPLPSDFALAKHLVVITDLRNTGEHALLWRLVREHPSIVFDRKVVAIDMSLRGEHIEALRSSARPASLWWQWFVDPVRPPTEWVADDPAAVRALLDWGPDLEAIIDPTTRGGTPHGWDCPRGESLIAIEAATNDATPPAIAHLRARCAKATGDDGDDSPWFGGRTEHAAIEARCPSGAAMVGLSARGGRYLESVAPICASGKDPERKETTLYPIGGELGGATRMVCPAGSIVRGIRIRAGSLVDGIGIACGRL